MQTKGGSSVAGFSETSHDQICILWRSVTGYDACEPRPCAVRCRRPWLLRRVLSERKLPKLGSQQSVRRWRPLSTGRQDLSTKNTHVPISRSRRGDTNPAARRIHDRTLKLPANWLVHT